MASVHSLKGCELLNVVSSFTKNENLFEDSARIREQLFSYHNDLVCPTPMVFKPANPDHR